MLKIKKHGDRALFMQMHVADATYGSGEGVLKISLGNVIPTGDFIALVKKGDEPLRTYTLSMREFVEGVIACDKGEAEFELVDEKEKAS